MVAPVGVRLKTGSGLESKSKLATSIHCMFGPAAVATFENHNAFGSNVGVELFSTDLTDLGNGVPE